uniref:Uncharacterized protein n=1 Tax=Lepeophtheirus salmonis TaxID=72036 RepID=A0A0K2TWN0_LEPSM
MPLFILPLLFVAYLIKCHEHYSFSPLQSAVTREGGKKGCNQVHLPELLPCRFPLSPTRN